MSQTYKVIAYCKSPTKVIPVKIQIKNINQNNWRISQWTWYMILTISYPYKEIAFYKTGNNILVSIFRIKKYNIDPSKYRVNQWTGLSLLIINSKSWKKIMPCKKYTNIPSIIIQMKKKHTDLSKLKSINKLVIWYTSCHNCTKKYFFPKHPITYSLQ